MLRGTLIALVVLAYAPAGAGAVGELAQKNGPAGCLSETVAECRGARALLAPVDIVVSPDGGSVYAVTTGSSSVTSFRRDPSSGELSQQPGGLGCVAPAGSVYECAVARHLSSPSAVAISPDGASVYVTDSSAPGGILTFDRDATTGALRQEPGRAGCILDSEDPVPGDCAPGALLAEPRDVLVSPDGRSVFVATIYGVVGFARNPQTGALEQREGNGCITYGIAPCSAGRSIAPAIGFGLSHDGRSLYVATESELELAALAVLDVDPTSGDLAQKNGTAGCIVDAIYGDSGGCSAATGLGDPLAAVVSPDGKSVYAGRRGGLVVFNRASDGRLTQKPGLLGCISGDGTGGTCTLVPSFSSQSPLVSPSGFSVYSSSGAMDAIWTFDRAGDGALALKPGLAGCVSETRSPQCQDGHALDGPVAIAVSADGGSVYAASRFSNAIAVFDRDRTGEVVTEPDVEALPDTVAPTVRRFRLTPRRFRVARRPTPRVARVAAGSAFRFVLSERASARITLSREIRGRRVGGLCTPNSRALRRHPRCSLRRVVAVLRRREIEPGAVRLRFSGRIGHRPLQRGNYLARIVAKDAAGNSSSARRARFTIVAAPAAKRNERPRAQPCSAARDRPIASC